MIETIVVLLLLAIVCLGLVAIGFKLSENRLSTDRIQLERERRSLDAEWTALDNTRRIREVFLGARRMMQDENRAHAARPNSPRAGDR